MRRGEIWTVDMPFPAGKPRHEQIGTRPRIVVQTDKGGTDLPTTIVIPATARQEARRFPFTVAVQPSPENGLEKPSVLLVFQIRAIDKLRLIQKIGRLEDIHLKELENQLHDLLAI